jgi:hypothetical protein
MAKKASAQNKGGDDEVVWQTLLRLETKMENLENKVAAELAQVKERLDGIEKRLGEQSSPTPKQDRTVQSVHMPLQNPRNRR